MELIARVKSIFRRIELDKTTLKNNQIVKILDISINPDTKQVDFDGKNIGLQGWNFHCFIILSENKNKAVSRSELLDKVWGFENEVETRATDDMIKRIRKKLSDAGSVLKIETYGDLALKYKIRNDVMKKRILLNGKFLNIILL